MQQCIHKECNTAMQTVQLNKELALISFPMPPSTSEEGQIVDECPLPTLYETDVPMEGIEGNDEEHQCLDGPTVRGPPLGYLSPLSFLPRWTIFSHYPQFLV